MTADTPWPRMVPFPPDDPDGVRVVPATDLPKPPKTDDGARLGRPWEREARDDLDRALGVAVTMREEAEAFVGWIGRVNPLWAADYDYLIEEADARIARLERLAQHL
jgi:hypothetical protein